jgi:hypothetical protein
MNTARPFPLRPLVLLLTLFAVAPAQVLAWTLSGVQTITAHTQDKQALVIGTVDFKPQADGSTAFALAMNHAKFTDYFLSMKEFKCLGSPVEVTCHVPYPYQHPGIVSLQDLTWLEHNLLFLFKRPSEFGAKLWNGLYYRLKVTDEGLIGRPMAIDLNRISAPPENLAVPTFGPDARDEISGAAHWIESISIQ